MPSDVVRATRVLPATPLPLKHPALSSRSVAFTTSLAFNRSQNDTRTCSCLPSDPPTHLKITGLFKAGGRAVGAALSGGHGDQLECLQDRGGYNDFDIILLCFSPPASANATTLVSHCLIYIDIDIDIDIGIVDASCLSVRFRRFCVEIGASGPALYKLASRMNHSCDPSCCWYTETAVKGVPGPRAVRAVRNIAFGDEITISYSLHQLKTGPQSFLTQDLLDSKFFRCRCGRCTSPDLARAFRCPTEGCAALRHPWPESIGANAAAGPIFGTCSGCGSTSSQAEERRLLGVEARLSSNVRRVEGALKMGGGVANAKMMLGFLDREFAPDGDGSVTLHPGHWIAVKHQFLRYHACVFSTELPAAIAAIRLVVDHQRAIDPPSRQQAFDMEMLGDALLAHALSLSGDGDRDGFGAMSATATVEMLPWLLEAVATFRAELFLLQRINGPDHLYTTECRDKLKNAMAALHVFGGHTGVGDAASTVPPSPLTAADGEADHRLKCQGCVLDVCAAEVSLARLRVDDIRHRLERVSSTPKKTF